jgi:hypothetical protein
MMTGGLVMDSGELQAVNLEGLAGSCWYAQDNTYCRIRKEMVRIHITGTDDTGFWVDPEDITVQEGLGGEISFSCSCTLTEGSEYRADFWIGTTTCFATCEIGVIRTTFTDGTLAFSTQTPEIRASWNFTSTDPLVISDLTCSYTDNNGSHDVPESDITIQSQDGGYSGTVTFVKSGSWTGGTLYIANVSADGTTAGAQATAPTNLITIGVDTPERITNIITVTVHTPVRQ